MNKFFAFISQTRVIYFFAVLTLILTFVLHFFYSDLPGRGSREVLSLQFAFNGHNFSEIISRWGENGIHIFLKYMALDYVYPVSYASFFSGLMGFVLKKKNRAATVIMFLPLMSALFDFAENSTHIHLLTGGPPYNASLILLASLAASVKYSFLVLTLLILGGFAICPKLTNYSQVS